LALSNALLQVSGISDEELHVEKLKPDEALAKLKMVSWTRYLSLLQLKHLSWKSFIPFQGSA